MRRGACAGPLVAAGLLGAAAACGSGGGDVAMTTDPAAVLETTVATTARVSISVDVSAARAEWESALRDLPGDPELNLGSALADIGFEGIVDLRSQRIHLEATGLGRGEDELAEMFVDHTRAYVRYRGGPWYFTELRERDSEAVFLAIDPLAPLEDLAAGGPLEALGADQVRGEPVTHYRTTSGTGEGAETVEVWVDDEGRAVRIRTTPPATPPTTVVFRDGEDGLATVLSVGGMQMMPSTTEFWDFGVAFDATPPADAIPAPP